MGNINFLLGKVCSSLVVFNGFPKLILLQFYLSYHLYIVACAGAGATVIALVRVHDVHLFTFSSRISLFDVKNYVKLLRKELLCEERYSAIFLN